MRCSALIIILLSTASTRDSAWYQKVEGTIVDPIQSIATGGSHSCPGNKLKPSANLAGAYLFYADLRDADLSGANLSGADLVGGPFRLIFMEVCRFSKEFPLNTWGKIINQRVYL